MGGGGTTQTESVHLWNISTINLSIQPCIVKEGGAALSAFSTDADVKAAEA